ncbi:aspartate/glutamate racemase family protein [Novosphingobium sp. FSW06-99]|uniref:aspartate/glutamate racemase family protein n=1 Tax=Novosphingobium sp. FSW06-99 TaxID=1739113 RepID=UPI00076D80E3|nr:aspartate/glutamate racemase family protein [Novosphingobium sp. FSW06-99]KUR76998.1 aspartate racemase [Novosphingobium sp. FSW06-99]
MKTLGLLGGLSWESSAEYYRLINQGVRDALGPTHSAQILLWSFNFAELEAMQHAGDWPTLTARMVDAARRLEEAGADTLLICSNTMHQCASAIEAQTAIPLLHIIDPTAQAIRAAGLTRIGLIGTRFTMERDFYKGRLADHHGLDVIVPDAEDRAEVHRVIYQELVAGRIESSSREAYRGIIGRLVARGAQAIVLGCTEIMLLIGAEDSPVPLFDTTVLHAGGAVRVALG